MSAHINGINSVNNNIDIENNIIKLPSLTTSNNILTELIYSSGNNVDFTSVNSNIVPDAKDMRDLGTINKNWANAYIRDLSVTNIEVS